MTSKSSKTASIKTIIASGLFFLLLFFPSYSGYSWSSTELTGMFTTHQFLTRTAYGYLEKHPMIRDHIIPFPPLAEIEKYCGLNIKVVGGGVEKTGEGPDNPSKSSFADHYFNPTFPGGGRGNAPDRINENYAVLRTDISVGTINDKTARSAAYLAHYIQDMTCPFHVLGAPDNDLRFTAQAAGPYITKYGERICVLKEGFDLAKVCANPVTYLVDINLRFFEQDEPGFWNMMVARYKIDDSPGRNWFEPNYYNGHICPIFHTYLSTHFLYEAMVANYHNNPEMISRFSHLSNINLLTNNWNSLSLSPVRAGEFAKKLARLTREDLDNNDPEFMFDPRQLISYIYIGHKALGYMDILPETLQKKIVAMKSTVPVPEKAWTTAIQATYTVWRSAFSALFVDCEKDVLLFQTGSNPDTYVAKVKLTNYEPGETARDISVKLKQVSKGLDREIGEAVLPQLAGNQNNNSAWLQFKEPFPLQESAYIKVTVTGTFDRVPDAGSMSYTSKNPVVDPLGGTWKFQEANALISILYNAATQQYEGRVIKKGGMAFHEMGALWLSGIKPVQTAVMTAQYAPDDKIYTGTECSWEVLTNPDGSYRKGQPTRLSASITVNGNTMVFRTKDDTFHFTRD
jgi:hypothetical protein